MDASAAVEKTSVAAVDPGGCSRSFLLKLTGQCPQAARSNSWRDGDSIFFSSRRFWREAKALLGLRSRQVPPGRAPIATIVFIPLPAAQGKPETDWAETSAEGIVRRCPVCACDSIVGHGRRRKQAHDEYHDWIRIQRGFCNICGKTITFLPMFSLPYTHYSLIARSEALRRYFVDSCSWEAAAPPVKDPCRVADPSTLRRWFRDLDSSQPPFSFLQRTILKIDGWIRGCGKLLHHDDLLLSWPTVFPFLRRFWPLRI